MRFKDWLMPALTLTVLAALLAGWRANRTTVLTFYHCSDLSTPYPWPINPEFIDPVDFENVPSYREIVAYVRIVQRRKLTSEEVRRMVEIGATSQHPLTLARCMAIFVDFRDQFEPHRGTIIASGRKWLANPNNLARVSGASLVRHFEKPAREPPKP